MDSTFIRRPGKILYTSIRLEYSRVFAFVYCALTAKMASADLAALVSMFDDEDDETEPCVEPFATAPNGIV